MLNPITSQTAENLLGNIPEQIKNIVNRRICTPHQLPDRSDIST